MNLNSDEIIEIVGEFLREELAKMRAEVRRTDRAQEITLVLESLRIEESLAALRTWVHSLTYERSRLVEARSIPPAPWLAALDAEDAP